MAGQRVLRKIAGERPIDGFRINAWLSVLLYRKLDEHAYLDTEEFPDTLSDTVPNRHATMHGRASYSTHQNSINALILADYVFQVIHNYKEEFAQQVAQSAA